MIASKYRLYYDMFTPPAACHSYIPNERIQNLLSMFQEITHHQMEVQKFELSLRNSLLMQSWSYPAETTITAPLLNIFFTEVYKLLSPIDERVAHSVNTAFPFPMQLCTQFSKQEMFISYLQSILLASEAKGVESSDSEAMMQCLQACSDGALNLFSKGLASEDCVVPGVICWGETMTIVAVYFAPITFPVITYLSGSLHVCNCDDRLTLARWGVALNQFARQTIQLLRHPKYISQSNKDVRFRLSRNLFFKPVRNIEKHNGSSIDTVLTDCSSARVNLNIILNIYSLLYSVPLIKRYVLLPVGVVSCPSHENPFGVEIRQLLVDSMLKFFPLWCEVSSYVHVPFVVFPLLREADGWSSLVTRPPVELVESFIAELSQAINALNEAKVAHMDLRYDLCIRMHDTFCFLCYYYLSVKCKI